jgi:hypothetical protein
MTFTITNQGKVSSVAGQTRAQEDVDKIQHLIAEHEKAVDTTDAVLVREIWLDSPDVSFIRA